VVLQKHAQQDGGQQAFIDGLLREIDQRWAQPQTPLSSINGLYVGGGTPSLLPASAYKTIFNHINQYVPFAPEAEITLEVNPLGISDSPEAYLEVGFNRVSVGVQSFNDAELKKLSRIHNAQQAETQIRQLSRAGFKNISLDLMYGIPLQTEASWKETLHKAMRLNPQHISMYGLKIERGTPLHTLVNKGFYAVPDDEAHVALYESALEHLAENGLYQYEFSNFARPGYQSRHNLNYWNNQPFWAFGPSAHGYINGVRYENQRSLAQWLENPVNSKEHLCSTQEKLENTLIFGLRKTEGVHIPSLERRFNLNFMDRYGWILQKYACHNFFKFNDDYLTLTRGAIQLSNVVLAEFIEV